VTEDTSFVAGWFNGALCPVNIFKASSHVWQLELAWINHAGGLSWDILSQIVMVSGGGIHTDPAISTLETSIWFSWIDLVPSGREGKEGGPSCDQSRKFSIESTVLNQHFGIDLHEAGFSW
jgi:hypothetical protein